MLGIILWRDAKGEKAVIWCEDHGDLAFFKSARTARGRAPAVGEWVEFEVVTEKDQRRAINLKLMGRRLDRDIQRLLVPEPTGTAELSGMSGTTPGPDTDNRRDRGVSAEIIAFAPLSGAAAARAERDSARSA